MEFVVQLAGASRAHELDFEEKREADNYHDKAEYSEDKVSAVSL